jgi:hypothetical protein
MSANNSVPMATQYSARGRYGSLEVNRNHFLSRARDCAELTIPSLMPPEGYNGTTKLYTPYQGIGARGVNNLASKLLLALLPPNAPFFRMTVDDFTLEKMTQQKGMRAEVEKALSSIERAVMQKIESEAIRVATFEVLKQLIVSGNALVHVPDQGGMKVYRLDRFVVVRDPMGNVLEMLVKEPIAPAALPDKILESVWQGTPEQNRDPSKHLDLFTCIKLKDGKMQVHQEINDIVIKGSQGSYPVDRCPWIPLRWTQLDGEDYGRSYVDEYFGDLRSLEGLTQAIVEGSAAAAKVLMLVNPNGTTRLKDVAEAPNLAVKPGNAADVTVLQLQKFNDFRVALETMQMIQQRLSFAFLLNTAIQRGGERVTAEEIRYMAGELEDALGGVYSILSQEFQLPLVNVMLDSLQRSKKLPVLPKGTIKPSITTGMEALGRGHDLSRLNMFIQQLAPLGEAVQQYLNIPDFISRVGTSLNIDTDGLIKSEEQVQQSMMQMQAMQMMSQAVPKGMDIARDQMDPQTGNIDAAQIAQSLAGAIGGRG